MSAVPELVCKHCCAPSNYANPPEDPCWILGKECFQMSDETTNNGQPIAYVHAELCNIPAHADLEVRLASAEAELDTVRKSRGRCIEDGKKAGLRAEAAEQRAEAAEANVSMKDQDYSDWADDKLKLHAAEAERDRYKEQDKLHEESMMHHFNHRLKTDDQRLAAEAALVKAREALTWAAQYIAIATPASSRDDFWHEKMDMVAAALQG